MKQNAPPLSVYYVLLYLKKTLCNIPLSEEAFVLVLLYLFLKFSIISFLCHIQIPNLCISLTLGSQALKIS